MGPHSSSKEAFLATKKCLRLKAPQVSKQPDGLELRTCSLFVEFFLLGSNESIPRPGFLFQQKVIAWLSLRKDIATLEHLDDQERKRQRNVEQKGQLKKIKGKRKERTRKGNEGRRNDK